MLSEEPVSTWPLGENATVVIVPVWPDSVASGLPVAACHSRAVLSWEPVSTSRPSGENATAVSGCLWPDSVASGLPVAACHSRAVLSKEPVSASRPSDAIEHPGGVGRVDRLRDLGLLAVSGAVA